MSLYQCIIAVFFKTLIIRDNDIGPAGAEALATVLTENCTITTLILQCVLFKIYLFCDLQCLFDYLNFYILSQ